MTRPARLKYATFTLRGDAQGIVHLDSELPEVVAIGMDVIVDFIRKTPPLGGEHAEMNTGTRLLHIDTPECSFTYECIRPEYDTEGWFFLFKRVYVSSAYAGWVATRA